MLAVPSELRALSPDITVLIPHLPFAAVLGFGIVPPHFYPILALIIFAYIAVAEATKILFYRHTVQA